MKKQTTSEFSKKLASMLFKRTQEWAEKEGLLKKKDTKSKYSPKAQKLAEICNKAGFGCQDQFVRDILEILSDEKIPSKKQDKTHVAYIHGVVIVPLTSNVSGAIIGEPVLITVATGDGIPRTGKSVLCPIEIRLIRPATLVEIEYLIEELSQKKEFETQVLQLILAKLGE